MTATQRASIIALLIAPFVTAASIGSASSADRSNGHALALSHRYGAYTKPGNLAAGQTVVIDTPEGPIACTGGVNREYTGKKGPEGGMKHEGGVRGCHFN